MERQITVTPQHVVVKLSGRMNNEDATTLKQELMDYVNGGHTLYVVDMSDLRQIDSAGLGVLIAINKSSQLLGGSVTLTGLKGTVRELFEVTRLHKVFHIEP